MSIFLVYKKALAPGRQAVNLSSCLEKESGRIQKKPFKLARSGTGKREQAGRGFRERIRRSQMLGKPRMSRKTCFKKIEKEKKKFRFSG